MLRALQRRWFLLALGGLLFVGIWRHERLEATVARIPQDFVVASVLLAMSLCLETRAMWNALRRPLGAALAITVNLAVVPPLAWAAGRMLQQSLADGMVVSAAIPCTMASAAVWTRRAGGNETIAILTTMATSLICVVATPAWLLLLTGRTGGGTQNFVELVVRLALVVALPIFAGQLLRVVPAIRHWARSNARGLSLYAQAGILTMVLLGAVECGKQLSRLEDGLAPLAGQLAAMFVLAAAVHVAAWSIGYGAAKRLGLAPPDCAGVAFAGSQKTLMVGLAIAIDFGGLAVLPMVAYHVEQLLIDTVLADRLRANVLVVRET